MASDYQRGYLDGYRDGPQDLSIGDDEAERQTFAEGMGESMSGEELSSYWLGYRHGRIHARTGKPCEGAVKGDDIPAGL